MNIYLDVDGTILLKNKTIVKNLYDLLNGAFSKGDVYWLTTHCKENDNRAVLTHLEAFVSDEEMQLLKKIKPTKWQTLKTEAIDFSKPFLWFDDYLLQAEQQVLKDRGVLDSWVPVNLSNVDQLILNFPNDNKTS